MVVNANQVNLSPFGGDERQPSATFAPRGNREARATNLRIFHQPFHTCVLSCNNDGTFTMQCTNTETRATCTENFDPFR